MKISNEIQKDLDKKQGLETESLIKALGNNLFSKKNLRVSDRKLVEAYNTAKIRYETGQYREALVIFSNLIFLEKNNPTFVFGLASCLWMLKDYDKAIMSFLKYSTLNPKDPLPYYYLYLCYEKKNDLVSMFTTLKMLISRAGNQPQYKSLKNRAELTLEQLIQKTKKGDQSTKLVKK